MKLERRLKIIFSLLAAFGCFFLLVGTALDPRITILGSVAFALASYYITERVYIIREGGKAQYQVNRQAASLIQEVETALQKYAQKVKPAAQQEVAEALITLKEQEPNNPKAQQEILEQLENKFQKYYAFARKSAVREYVESIGGAVLIALLLRALIVEAFQIPSGSMIPTLHVGDYLFVSKSHYGIKLPFASDYLFMYRKPTYGDIVVFTHPNPRPQDEGKDLIKRVVALEGDEVSIHDGVVTINKKEMKLSSQGEYRYFDMSYDTVGTGHPPLEESKLLYQEDLMGVSHQVLYERWGAVSCGLSKDTSCWSRQKEECRWPPKLCVEESESATPFVVPPGHVFVMGDNRDDSDDSRAWGPVPISAIKGKALFIWFAGRIFWPPDVNTDRIGILLK